MLVYDKNTDFITLPGLEKDAAVLLLTQKSQTKDYNSEDAMRIVERLGYHPLAITQAGAYIWQRELQLCDFIEHHKNRKEVILKTTPRFSQYRQTLGYAEEGEVFFSLVTSYELSFQQLQSKASKNDCKAKLLTLFAFFGNEDISEKLFAEFVTNEAVKSESAKLTHGLMGSPTRVANEIAVYLQTSRCRGRGAGRR